MSGARRSATIVVAVGTVALAGLAATPWGWVLEHPQADAAGSWLLRAWTAWVLMVLTLVAFPTVASGRRLHPVDVARWGGLGAAAIAADVLGHAVLGAVPGAATIAVTTALAVGGAGSLWPTAIARALGRVSGRSDGLGDPAFVTDGALMATMHLVGMAGPASAVAFGGSMALAHGATRRRAGAVVLVAIGIAASLRG